MKKFMLLKLDVKYAKDPTTPKIAYNKKKGKPLKKLTIRNLVDLFKEEDIELQLQDSIKGTTQILQIRASTDAAIRNQGASIKTLVIQIRQMNKVLQERGFGSLPSSMETKPRDQVKSISTIDGANLHLISRIGRSQYAVSTRQDSNEVYKSRQMTIPFPSRLEYHYCEDNEESYGPKFAKAYGVSPIKGTIP
ncbi:hypothetical protein Tco_1467436 [Tanacetum coccineum]